MKSFFGELIFLGIVCAVFRFMDSIFDLGISPFILGIFSFIVVQITIINSKLDDILKSTKTDNYSNGVGIK